MCEDFLLVTKTRSAVKRDNATSLFARSEHVILPREQLSPNLILLCIYRTSWRVPLSYSFSNIYMHDLTLRSDPLGDEHST